MTNEACLSFAISMYGRESGYLKIKTVYEDQDIRYAIYKEGGYSILPQGDINSFWSMRFIPVLVAGTQKVHVRIRFDV